MLFGLDRNACQLGYMALKWVGPTFVPSQDVSLRQWRQEMLVMLKSILMGTSGALPIVPLLHLVAQYNAIPSVDAVMDLGRLVPATEMLPALVGRYVHHSNGKRLTDLVMLTRPNQLLCRYNFDTHAVENTLLDNTSWTSKSVRIAVMDSDPDTVLLTSDNKLFRVPLLNAAVTPVSLVHQSRGDVPTDAVLCSANNRFVYVAKGGLNAILVMDLVTRKCISPMIDVKEPLDMQRGQDGKLVILSGDKSVYTCVDTIDQRQTSSNSLDQRIIRIPRPTLLYTSEMYLNFTFTKCWSLPHGLLLLDVGPRLRQWHPRTVVDDPAHLRVVHPHFQHVWRLRDAPPVGGEWIVDDAERCMYIAARDNSVCQYWLPSVLFEPFNLADEEEMMTPYADEVELIVIQSDSVYDAMSMSFEDVDLVGARLAAQLLRAD